MLTAKFYQGSPMLGIYPKCVSKLKKINIFNANVSGVYMKINNWKNEFLSFSSV